MIVGALNTARTYIDPASLQNYLMSWLQEAAADSEQLHIVFPQSDGTCVRQLFFTLTAIHCLYAIKWQTAYQTDRSLV